MITERIQRLEPGSLVRLFELDLSNYGGEVLRFHGHMEEGSILWQGNSYDPVAIEATGLELSQNRTVAPSLQLANNVAGIQGAVSALCMHYNDFAGSRLTIRETFAELLDAGNFAGGNAHASDEEVVSVWYIEQKSSENAEAVSFELSSPANFNNQLIPSRQITSHCAWALRGEYRGESCGYTGPYVDIEGGPTDDPSKDRCSGLLNSGCKARFGKDAELPFGGFPSAGLMK